MKGFFQCIALLATALLFVSCAAPQQVASATADLQDREPSAGKNKQVLTGSLVPQSVNVNGLVTDGINPVYVIDQDSIKNSGALTVPQVLSRKGLGH